MSAVTFRENAMCVICLRSGVDLKHPELNGVVLVGASWVCASCTRLAVNAWSVRARAALLAAGKKP